MKSFILTLFSAALLLSSCGQSKSETPVEDSLPAPEQFDRNTPYKSDTFETDDTVRWRGQVCHYHIVSQSSEELGIVETETGRKYCETSIDLSITLGGEMVFQHRFTKADFAEQLPADLRRIGLLCNITLHEVKDGSLKFTTSVAEPQSDYYVPFGITITSSGQMTIKAEEDNFREGAGD